MDLCQVEGPLGGQQLVSAGAKERIERILNDVSQLSDVEKLYLYLRLPGGAKVTQNNPASFYPLLGKKSHSQVGHTYAWIRGHLEEDRDVSLPKQEVYNEYKAYFEAHSLEALCTADFGKVMKHVFPGVRARRLGERGNSRYCYSGLSKKVKSESPSTINLETPGVCTEQNQNQSSKRISQLRLLLDEYSPGSPAAGDAALLDSGVSSVATSPRERPASGPGVFTYYPTKDKGLGETQEFAQRLRSQSAPIEPIGNTAPTPAGTLTDDFLPGGGIEFDDVFSNMDLLTNPQE
ncbi:RFX-like DNA-binding protein RFX1 isoform X2 [Varroa jacobsoni]|uniref:RFX-type winged-helix domain-containing protein n=1 Tax=Varroa destructor TaxID=109461 RepID=A0A7M7KML6_VARDE|nr:RFX-like DNA-binding protein RFX1 [Varroa destructor]XP_022704036.1 RFX-like DNA-binding protein RFX1 isoform X2 [Varroa jacobsoni]